MGNKLQDRHCKPCEGGVEALSHEAATAMVGQLEDGWALSADGKEIRRDYSFGGFYQTMGFANAVAWLVDEHILEPVQSQGKGDPAYGPGEAFGELTALRERLACALPAR